MKKFLYLICSFLLICTLSASDQEIPKKRVLNLNAGLARNFYQKAFTHPELLKPGQLILFTNARNEKNIKEWAAHHLLLGFDLIYIFDHKSDEPLIHEFKNFDPRVIVERCEWENPVKLPLMNRAAFLANKLQASWMLYLDADEFLVLNDLTHVKELLDAFSHADSIGINWLFFGSNYHIKEPGGLIVNNYTRSELIINQHVKTFVRPKQIVKANNPHYYVIKNPKKMYSINNAIMNPHEPYFNQWETEYFNAPAYFAHYVYQAEETYLKRKVDLPRDDCGDFRPKIPNIHLEYNDIENFSVKEKYGKQIEQFLTKQPMH